MADQLDSAFAAGELPGLHGVRIMRGGEVVAERYYAGADQRWGMHLGVVEHHKDSLHDIRSVTKSIVGLLYGIALKERAVPLPSTPLIDHFIDHFDSAIDHLPRRISVADALTMRMGTEWNEDIPYSDPANSERAMEAAPDRYRYILDRPMVAEPGTTWTYNGGATALLGHLIARGTGMTLDDYARSRLFEPLGIVAFDWIVGSDGEPSAASGLRLTLPDLGKIGELVLADGVWEGRQLVRRDWLEESFTPRAEVEAGLEYGYQWWLGRLIASGEPWCAGFGNGGQRLWVIPSLDLIVAIFAGNYNAPDQWKMPLSIMTRFVIPWTAAEGARGSAG